MAQFESIKGEIAALGALLVYVAAEKRQGMFKPEKFLTEHPISFPFLFDEDRRMTKEYGVYHWLALDAINIARPATFVVDREGMIRFLYVGLDQRDRVPTEAVIHVLKGLQDQPPRP